MMNAAGGAAKLATMGHGGDRRSDRAANLSLVSQGTAALAPVLSRQLPRPGPPLDEADLDDASGIGDLQPRSTDRKKSLFPAAFGGFGSVWEDYGRIMGGLWEVFCIKLFNGFNGLLSM